MRAGSDIGYCDSDHPKAPFEWCKEDIKANVEALGFNLDDDKGETIGIVLVGHHKFNELQTKALNKLVNDLINKYGQLQIKSTIRELGI